MVRLIILVINYHLLCKSHLFFRAQSNDFRLLKFKVVKIPKPRHLLAEKEKKNRKMRTFRKLEPTSV